MNETLEDAVNDDDGAETRPVDAQGDTEDQMGVDPSTALVEVTPGVAVVFGEVPDGLDLISLDLMPAFDRAQLSASLGTLGNAGTIIGNLTEAARGAAGLYQLDNASLSLLKSGGEMAVKDGARIGAIFKNGKLVAQARFIPASMSVAAAAAAIGPAVAMIGLQMQLGELTSLARTNIALTTQTLKAIRNAQWAELEGLAETVGEAIEEARELEDITDTVWEPIAPHGKTIRTQLKLYRKQVSGHVQELKGSEGNARRQYLESNAEAIVFDTYALVSALKTYAEYQTIRAAVARSRGSNNENDAQVFELITHSTPAMIEESLHDIGVLTDSLVRELRIIAELPGRATVPLTKKRKDAKTSRLTCEKLLEAIEPLSNKIHPAVDMPARPSSVCAPEDLDIEPYLRVLRWFLEDGETLRSVGFAYEVGAHNLAGVVPAVLAKRVDATWDALGTGTASAMLDKFTSSVFVAVTDRRIITASPRDLLQRGELGVIYSFDEVKFVRPRTNHSTSVRPTIGITTEVLDIQWMFPAGATHESIDELTAVISSSTTDGAQSPLAVSQQKSLPTPTDTAARA